MRLLPLVLIFSGLLAVHALDQHRQPLGNLTSLADELTLRRRAAGPTLNPGDPCSNPDQCLSGGCGDNGVCDSSVVGKGCAVDSDCLQGTCQQGLCFFLPPTAPCTADSQCVSNACNSATGSCFPISGQAGAACMTGLDCPSLSCTNFVCDASTQGQPCNAASDCATTIQGQGPCLYNRCFGFFNPCADRTMCFDGICRGSGPGYCYGRDSDPCDWNSECASQNCDAQDTGMCVGGPRVLTPPPAPSTSSTTSTSTSTSSSASTTTSSIATTSSTSTSTTSSSTSTVSSTSTPASTSKSSTSSSSTTTSKPTSTNTPTTTRTSTTSTTSGLPMGASCTTNAQCSTGYCRKALLSDGQTRASTGVCGVKRTDGSPCYQNGGCVSGKCVDKVCAASTSTTTTTISKSSTRTTSTSTKTTSTTTTTTTTNLPSAATCTTNTQCKSQYCRKPLQSDGKTRARSGTCQDKKASGSPCYQNGGCTSNKCVSAKCA